MSTLSVTAVRACAVIGVGAAVAVGAWAVPTQGGSAPAVVADVEVAAPDVTVPALASATERSVDAEPAPASQPAESTTTTIGVAVTGEVADPGEPDHLAPIVEDTPEPQPVVTTTTTVAPPTTTAAPAPAVTVAFAAAQIYGSCGEAVPYDLFSGSATPGSTISISSPYGSGSTVADEAGHWSTKVEFPSAPRGETFSVTVNGLGGAKTFSFTATGEAHA